MSRQALCTLVGCALLSVACVEDDISPNAPRPAGRYDVFQTEVPGLSGLCLNAAGDGLVAVSDKGGVYELDFDGTTRRVLCDSSHDFEAVTSDGSGAYYIAEEGENAIYRLSGGRLELVAEVDVPGGGVANKGLEGICWCGESLLVANQAQPTLILRYSLLSGGIEEQIPIDFATFLSDICYDSARNALWILDSKQKRISVCTPKGVVQRTYAIDFVTKAEAMALDRSRGVVWLGCDESGRLYRVEMTI